jgi:hypothetical protein
LSKAKVYRGSIESNWIEYGSIDVILSHLLNISKLGLIVKRGGVSKDRGASAEDRLVHGEK